MFLGKLNMHEFAYGGTSAVTHYGPVHNPWNLDYTPGGSSGGSAAAVAARLCAAALGTDTAASVRFPAACCGVGGSQGDARAREHPRHRAAVGDARSRGPLARSVADCGARDDGARRLRSARSREHPRDSPRTITRAIGRDVSALRIGIPRSPFFDGLDPEIDAAVRARSRCSRHHAPLSDVSSRRVDTFAVLAAETYAYHAALLADPPSARSTSRSRCNASWAARTCPRDYIEQRRRMIVARNTIGDTSRDVDVLVTPT